MDYVDYSPLFAGLLLVFALINLIWFILGIILFIKIWFACSDISDLRKASSKVYDLDQDLQFWTRAKYESDKRLGVITELDMTNAESYLNNNSQ